MIEYHIGEQVIHETLGIGFVKKVDARNVHVEFNKEPNYFISLDQAPLHLKPYRFLDINDVVRHSTYGIGIVQETDPLYVIIKFTKAGDKQLDWLIAERRCTKRCQGGLAHYLYEHRQAAFQLTNTDPKLLVQLALIDLGREARTDDIRRELVLYGFIKDDDWGTWWKSTAPMLRNDPLFDATQSRRQLYRLREKPKDLVEQAIDRFIGMNDFDEQFRIAKQIYEKNGKSLTLAQLDLMSQPFLHYVRDEETSDTQRIQAFLILKKLRDDFDEDPLKFITKKLDLSQIIHSADAEEIIKLVLKSDFWGPIIVSGLLSKTNKIREYCLNTLVEAKEWDYLRQTLIQLMENLPENGDIFLWLLDVDLEQNFPLGFDPDKLMMSIFSLFDNKKYHQKAIDLACNQKHIELIISITDDLPLKELLDRYFRSDRISFFTKELILSLLEESQRDELLSHFSSIIGKEMKRTDVIVMTKEEYEIMEGKLNHHIDNELVEITEKIAEITKEGESYQKLKRRQKVVINRIQQLKQTLKTSRVISEN